jgi:hypothetical protein
MNLKVMNGTNAVGMQGTNAAPLNGTNYVGMQGTNAAPLNGMMYDDDDEDEIMYVPIQGATGEAAYINPLALVQWDDVPMQGVPAYYDDDDRDFYRIGYMYGDQDALNGDFEAMQGKRRERRQAKKAARAEKKAARQTRKEERQAMKSRRQEARTARSESGTRFIDKFSGVLKDVGGGLAKKFEAEGALVEAGIEPDMGVLEDRAFLEQRNQEIGGGTGIGGWWQNAPMWQKGAAVASLALVGYGIYKIATKKKGRK